MVEMVLSVSTMIDLSSPNCLVPYDHDHDDHHDGDVPQGQIRNLQKNQGHDPGTTYYIVVRAIRMG